jgi:DEAD/DEAH box helicase domain-containing protein
VDVDDTVAWLRDRPYYDGQIEHHRVVPGRTARTRGVELEGRLASALADRGIDALYEHQADAVGAVRDGENVVLATPTASGKSLAYTVPAFERAMDRGATTLYVAPQRALINDQEDTLSDLAHGLGFGSRVDVAQYTGRLDRSEKGDVRDRRPTVLLTTPDMLHYGILPHAHRLWDWFVERLELVVIDEVHEYRGVFGSHVSLVLRRLARVCERFDADPDYVCCSATIGNPREHAATVTGRPAESFALVDADASATGPTHWLFWNPPEYEDPARAFGDSGRRRSSHTETRRLFVDLVSRGYQTAVFTRSRQTAERYASDSADDLRDRGEADLAASVAAYQAALGRERRAEVESGLHSGEVRGVWSTSALELGVDVGGLDAVLIDGYPGTRMAAFQQAGRAGRGTDPSLVALVAGEDQLDQYVTAHPDEFFGGPPGVDGTDGERSESFGAAPERAVANPENERLLPDHVRSAAAENWLRRGDREQFGDGFPDLVAELTEAGDLERRTTDRGLRWTYAGGDSPQQATSLRTIGDREVDLIDARSGDRVASLGFSDALRDAHPGAVYHHQGQSYEVADLDLDRDRAELSPTWADWYTKPLHETSIVVEDDREATALSTREDVPLRFADVTTTERITGYERRDANTGEVLGRTTLELPETTLETRALYFTVPPELQARLEEAGDFPGAIHAAEHALISLLPLSVLCDRRDVGGLSTPRHPHTGRATVFVYDGYPGGVGLARSAYDDLERLLGETRELLADCGCADGCPSCVQSPHCGNANDPLDKGLAWELLDSLLDPDP